MKIVVISHKHQLLPLAFRLHRDGADLDVFVIKERYQQSAWGGLLETQPWERHRYEPLVEDKDNLVVVTDSPKGMEAFAGCPSLFGLSKHRQFKGYPHLLVGGWFDGENWHWPHWLVPEWGAWTGDLGPLVVGCLTLLNRKPAPLLNEILDSYNDQLKSESFRGLAMVGVVWNKHTKEFDNHGLVAGWPPLHTHLLLSVLSKGGLPELLTENVLVGGAKEFLMALPISVPPWPIDAKARPSVEIGGLTDDVMKHLFFHDMRVEGKKVFTGGLDGLVGVADGSGNSPAAARLEALGVARGIQLPEKQFRQDAGASVEEALIGLELLGLW
jgi:hypothetical protein